MQKDHLISINNFNKPVELYDNDSTYYKLMRLIWLEPGTYPTHPEMGVGIISHFRYGNDSELETLKSRISDQIRMYIPEALDAEVEVSYENKVINVAITINSVAYSFELSNEYLANL